MLHGVYTAYQHGLNRILPSSQAPMHVENTNCFSSAGWAVQPRSPTPNCLPLNSISPHCTMFITLHLCIMMRQVLYSLYVFISTSYWQHFLLFQWHINVFNSNQWWICWPIWFLGNTYRRLQFALRLQNMRLYNVQPIQTSVQSLYIHHSLIEVRELTSPDCLISGDLAACRR